MCMFICVLCEFIKSFSLSFFFNWAELKEQCKLYTHTYSHTHTLKTLYASLKESVKGQSWGLWAIYKLAALQSDVSTEGNITSVCEEQKSSFSRKDKPLIGSNSCESTKVKEQNTHTHTQTPTHHPDVLLRLFAQSHKASCSNKLCVFCTASSC